MVVEYVGTGYAGFQRQSNANSVQATIERAAYAATGDRVTVFAAGRTDAGAHAFRQMVAFDSQSLLPAATLRNALNAHLPRDIAVVDLHDVSASFHPRFAATSRVYRYLVLNRPVRSPFYDERAWHIRDQLDVTAMHSAAQFLLGDTDLSSFVPVNKQGNKMRHVFRAVCERDGEIVRIELEATGFMKQMTRAIVGSLVDVGLHRIDVASFKNVIEARDRGRAAPTAPSHGLYLVDVTYDSVSHHHSPGCEDPETTIEEKG